MKNKSYADDLAIETAYQNQQYDQLQILLNQSNLVSSTAKYYKALVAENGLGQEIDKAKAIELYKKLYDEGKGNLKAGNALARIYQKQGDTDGQRRAVKIYQHVAKEKSPISAAYAEYRLARIEEKKILDHSQAADKTKIKEVIAQYDEVIKRDENVLPESMALAKALHHKALLLIKSTQEEARKPAVKEVAKKEEQEQKSGWLMHYFMHINAALNPVTEDYERDYKDGLKDQEVVKTKALAKVEAIVKTAKAKAALENQGILKEAQELLKRSGTLGYAAANAELLNIHAKADLTGDRYEETIDQCNDALQIDPKNINSKLLLANALFNSCKGEFNQEKYQRALDLTREVLLKDPQYERAIELRDALLKPLVKNIAGKITDHIIKNSKNFIVQSYYGSATLNGERIDAAAKYMDYLKAKIESALESQEYLRASADFRNEDDISAKLSDVIWKNIHADLEVTLSDDNILLSKEDHKATFNSKDKLVGKLVKKRTIDEDIDRQITHWSTISTKHLNIVADPLLDPLIIKRQKFKEKIIKILDRYHQRCTVLGDPANKDLAVQVGANSISTLSEAADWASGPIGAFMGGTAGIAATLVGKGLGEAGRQYTQYRMMALKQAAEKFALIGANNVEAGSREHLNQASEQFAYIAGKIEECYGMQIDAVATDGNGIDKLAQAAAEKMLYNLNNTSALNQKLSDLNGGVIDSVLSSFSNYLVSEKITEAKCISILLEGLTKGQSRNPDEIIQTIQPLNWKADEVFSKPLVTNNGKDFYGDDHTDDKYLVRYQQKDMLKKHLKIKDIAIERKNNFGKAFKEHKEILSLEEKSYTPTQKKVSTNTAQLIDLNDEREMSKGLTRKLIASILTGLFGASMALYAVETFSVIATFGTSAVSIAPLVAAIGITSAMIPPIAIAVGIIGVGLILKGAIDGLTASKERDNFERNLLGRAQSLKAPEIKSEEDIAREAQLVQQQKREHAYRNKRSGSARELANRTEFLLEPFLKLSANTKGKIVSAVSNYKTLVKEKVKKPTSSLVNFVTNVFCIGKSKKIKVGEARVR